MQYPGGVHNKNAGGENGEDFGDNEDFMHEDSDVGPDEDMDDDDDSDDDETGADSSGADAESVGDIVLDVRNTRVKYKVTFSILNMFR